MNVVAFLLYENERLFQERRRILSERRKLKSFTKYLRDISDPFNIDPEYFRKFFRMSKQLVLQLIDLLHESISAPKLNSYSCTFAGFMLFEILCLRWLSKRSWQRFYKHPVSQATFSRCLNRLVKAISTIASQCITFPQTKQERQELSNRFLQYNAVPGIIRLIDCFIVKFVRPFANEEAFFNYKHAHSMNVQVICDDNYIIQNLRICPGSNNDKHLWRYSNIRQELQNLRSDVNIVREEGHYIFLASRDSGYTPSTVLLTPIRNAPEGLPEARYTSQHVRTRCKVEQLFGVLTNVWLGISRRRVLPNKPEKVALTIQASAVLHNFRRLNGVLDDLSDPNLHVHAEHDSDYYADGKEERDRLIKMYYT